MGDLDALANLEQIGDRLDDGDRVERGVLIDDRNIDRCPGGPAIEYVDSFAEETSFYSAGGQSFN